jgi:hypothetical protein
MHEIADKRMGIIGGTAILGTVYLIVFKGLGTPGDPDNALLSFLFQ